MKDMWIEAHKFLIDMKVGDSYISGGSTVELIQRTKTKLHLSNGVIVWIKNSNGVNYLDGKNVGKRSGGVHKQILRDVEGYLIYKQLTNEFNRN